MLHGAVANLAGDEELLDVDGEAMLVDVDWLVAEVRADGRQPDQHGEERQGGQPDGETVPVEQRRASRWPLATTCTPVDREDLEGERGKAERRKGNG